jgi:CDP-diacylglycerol--serine O-phosphatidyltransferase
MSDPAGGMSPRRRRMLRRRELTDAQREHRRRRIRRRGRRAYIRSVYSLPSLATLGNAVCGFGAIYVASVGSAGSVGGRFDLACYLIFIAMLFDAIDGRLARFARHTTDFGGQLDSLADVVSFGLAPVFIAIQVFHEFTREMNLPMIVNRVVWASAALYMCCALIRLARFNVSNEHGEQHHFSFLGLPSPGAAAMVTSFILMQQDLLDESGPLRIVRHGPMYNASAVLVWILPALVLCAGLLMVSHIRYPHLVNKYLRGRRSIQRLVGTVILLLLLVIVHQYTLGIGTLLYGLWAPVVSGISRLRKRSRTAPARTV